MISDLAGVICHGSICLVERIASIILCLFQHGSLVVFILVNMIQHVLFFLGYKHPVILLALPLCFTFNSTLCLSLLFNFSTFFSKIIKAVNKLLSEETFVLLEPIFLTTKSGTFNILYFKLDRSAGDTRYVDIKVISHKIIITAFINLHNSID